MIVYILFDKNNNKAMGVLYNIDMIYLPNVLDDFRVEELQLEQCPETKKFYVVVWPTRVNNDRYTYSIQPSTKEIFYLNTVRFNRYAYVLAYSEEEALKLGEKIFKENEL